MNKKVNIGILGCANIADRYSIKAFQANSNANVVSIASRSIDKAREWALRHGIPQAETYDDLIENSEVDAVYIPLPIGLHEEWIIKAAKAGKHIISEKSLASDLRSVKEIMKVCEDNDVVLYENFTCDYHPQHHKVVEVLNSGDLGKLYLFESLYGFPLIAGDSFRYNRDLGGSGLNESGSYQVYTVRKLLGKEPVSVFADLLLDNGVDMRGSIMMEFEGGFIANFSFNLNAVYQNTYSVWGEKGLVRVGRAYAPAPNFKPIVEVVKNENKQETITSLDIPTHNHFETIFAEFCDLILNKAEKGKQVKAKYEDILNQAKALEAIRISSKEKRKVFLSDVV